MKDPRFITQHDLQVSFPVGAETAIGTGGNTDFCGEVTAPEALISLLEDAARNDLRTVLIGRGSRAVFSDFGFRGLVIRNRLEALQISRETVTVGSGLPLRTLIHTMSEEGLGGFAELVEYGGTVGGALTDPSALLPLRQTVRKLTVLAGGEVQHVQPDFLHEVLNPVILSVELTAHRRPAEEIRRTMLTATQAALKAHPRGVPYLRVFGDAQATSALRQIGIAGERVGGAVVSMKDPNYIINEGSATSHDVYELAQRMKNRVKVRLQRTLHESAVWLGEW